jgi:hypothetical protein
MKKVLAVALIAITTVQISSAQNDFQMVRSHNASAEAPKVEEIVLVEDTGKPKKVDTTRIKIGNTKITIVGEPEIEKIELEEEELSENKNKENWFDEEHKDKKKNNKSGFYTDWGSIDLGLNDYTDIWFGLKKQISLDRLKSPYVNIHIVDFNQTLFKGYCMLSSGIGLEFNNYRFSKNLTLTQLSLKQLEVNEESYDMKKSKLVTKYINIPLAFTFFTKPSSKSSSYHITIGHELGYNIGSKTKQVSHAYGKVIQNNKIEADLLTLNWLLQFGRGEWSIFIKANNNFSNNRVFEGDVFVSGNPHPFPSPSQISFGFSTAFSGK